MAQPRDMRGVGDRIEALLGELRSSVDPQQWSRVEELLALVTELYGAGLSRVVALGAGQADGATLLDRLVDDELVASLLVLHGLHPQDLAARVAAALESVRPYLASHGGDVELLELDAQHGALRLRLLGSCDGCPSSSATLRYAVEQAIAEAAPEVTDIEVEGLTDEAPAPASNGNGTTTPVQLSRRPDEAVTAPAVL